MPIILETIEVIMNCLFCNIPKESYVVENAHFFAIKDRAPVTKGHSLIISKRHFQTFFEVSPEEILYLREIVLMLKASLDQEFHPMGFNLGMNCGKHAGQTIFHFHLHIIPRYSDEDQDEKTGGLREFVQEIL